MEKNQTTVVRLILNEFGYIVILKRFHVVGTVRIVLSQFYGHEQINVLQINILGTPRHWQVFLGFKDFTFDAINGNTSGRSSNFGEHIYMEMLVY